MLPTNSELQVILASTSRYRRELLSRLQVRFETASPNVDESPLPDEAPVATAQRLAVAKARAVAPLFPNHLIVGSDQVAMCESVRLDKPMGHANAVRQLRHVSGKTVVFHTAVALLNAETGRLELEVVPTQVDFRRLDDATIERYLKAEPAYDCAGSAKAEGLGISLIERIGSTDPTALIGLPLISLTKMLEKEGIVIP